MSLDNIVLRINQGESPSDRAINWLDTFNLARTMDTSVDLLPENYREQLYEAADILLQEDGGNSPHFEEAFDTLSSVDFIADYATGRVDNDMAPRLFDPDFRSAVATYALEHLDETNKADLHTVLNYCLVRAKSEERNATLRTPYCEDARKISEAQGNYDLAIDMVDLHTKLDPSALVENTNMAFGLAILGGRFDKAETYIDAIAKSGTQAYEGLDVANMFSMIEMHNHFPENLGYLWEKLDTIYPAPGEINNLSVFE